LGIVSSVLEHWPTTGNPLLQVYCCEQAADIDRLLHSMWQQNAINVVCAYRKLNRLAAELKPHSQLQFKMYM